MARISEDHLEDWVRRFEELSKILEDEFGYKAERIGGKMFSNSAEFTFRVKPTEKIDPDLAETDIARQFKRCAELLGLEPADLLRTFVVNGKRYKLIGYEISRSDCFVLLDEHGQRRWASEAIIPAIQSAKIPA